MTATTATLRRLRPEEVDWANTRYAEIQFALCRPDDYVVVAEIDGQPVGLGRLVQVDATSAELGGIYVFPAFRGASVARTIVQGLLDASSHALLYCIPFNHLTAFYESFGFTRGDCSAALPPPIADKLKWCATKYDAPVTLLVRRRPA